MKEMSKKQLQKFIQIKSIQQKEQQFFVMALLTTKLLKWRRKKNYFICISQNKQLSQIIFDYSKLEQIKKTTKIQSQFLDLSLNSKTKQSVSKNKTINNKKRTTGIVWFKSSKMKILPLKSLFQQTILYTFQTCLMHYYYAVIIYQFKNNMKKRQGQVKEAPSKVLLICVYDTVIIQVTNQIVYARFSPYGSIVKILIFEKGEVTKFFLQFYHLDDAVKAKTSLDGSKLYESICKMNIYYSNFASVDLKHETTEGVSLQNSVYLSTPNYYYCSPLNYYNYPCYYNIAPDSQYVQLTQAFYNFDKQNHSHDYSRNYCSYNYNQTPPEIDDQIEKTIESSIDWLLKSEQKKANEKEHCLSQEMQEKSCFLQFELKQDLHNRNIYNLFSNFGNISYIKKTKKSVYIKFRTVQFAAMAKNYLQGYQLLSNYLDLSYVNDLSEAHPKEQEYSQITYFDPSFDRFTPHKSITINPPSNTIHVSSLRRDSCKVDNLKYMFSEFGQVQAVQILGNNFDKNMALIKFRNIEDSFYAIAEMHNKQILGRKIQISFTKSKLY